MVFFCVSAAATSPTSKGTDESHNCSLLLTWLGTFPLIDYFFSHNGLTDNDVLAPAAPGISHLLRDNLLRAVHNFWRTPLAPSSGIIPPAFRKCLGKRSRPSRTSLPDGTANVCRQLPTRKCYVHYVDSLISQPILVSLGARSRWRQ